MLTQKSRNSVALRSVFELLKNTSKTRENHLNRGSQNQKSGVRKSHENHLISGVKIVQFGGLENHTKIIQFGGLENHTKIIENRGSSVGLLYLLWAFCETPFHTIHETSTEDEGLSDPNIYVGLFRSLKGVCFWDTKRDRQTLMLADDDEGYILNSFSPSAIPHYTIYIKGKK